MCRRWAFSGLFIAFLALLQVSWSQGGLAIGFIESIPDRLSVWRIAADNPDSPTKPRGLPWLYLLLGNSAPVANAGSDRVVPLGAVVSLDGNGSRDSDGDPLHFLWALASKPTGSAAQLSSTTNPKTSFVADALGSFVATLTVNDGKGESDTDAVTITVVLPEPPVPPPSIADFDPKAGPVGTLVTITGSNFAPSPGMVPQVTMNERGGGTMAVPKASFSDTSIVVTVPAGADSGPLTVTVGDQGTTSAASFTVEPSGTFTLSAVPAAAMLIRGQEASYAVSLESANGFAQLAALGVSGLPGGVTASFTPAQIGAGQTAILSLSAASDQPVESVPLMSPLAIRPCPGRRRGLG